MTTVYLWCARMLAGLTQLGRDVVHRERVDREIDAELQGYVDLLVIEMMANGIAPVEARNTAMAQLGDPDQVKAAVRQQRAPAAVRTAYEDADASLRESLRVLFVARATAATVTVLAVGIAGNVALSNLALIATTHGAPPRSTTAVARATRALPAVAPFGQSGFHAPLMLRASADSATGRALVAGMHPEHRDPAGPAAIALPDATVPPHSANPPL